MAARCLLIEDGDKLILIDTGMGDKQSEKFFGYYNPWGDESIDRSLKNAGFHRDDVTDIFLTHLHFDHCGGCINGIKKEQVMNRPLKKRVSGAIRNIGNGQPIQMPGKKLHF
jgi:glyoxylase-like metal-dependent hydrolase (beta-lactamase superfamily II)